MIGPSRPRLTRHSQTTNIFHSSINPSVPEPTAPIPFHNKVMAASAYHGSLGRNSTPSPRRRAARPPASPDRFQHSYDKAYDAVVFDLLKVEPETIAAQITLGDLPLFKAIRPEELTSCAWTSKHKLTRAPNVVAYTKRFNHINFWVQKEILKEEALGKRACILAHFVKICKKLVEMNNLQSAMSLLSALQSAAVYRLQRTWDALSRRDRATFDKLAELFSESNNRRALREYCDITRLPCLPYLGMFLTDLTYIDVAHPSTGGLESQTRQDLMNNILRVISEFQCSEYNIEPLEHIQKYLNRQQYIEELQKFVEDDNFKSSLRLEPDHSSPAPAAAPEPPPAPRAEPPPAGAPGPRPATGVRTLPPGSAPHGRFVPGHRKAKSLGASANLFPSVSTGDLRPGSPAPLAGVPGHLLDACVTDAASARCLVPTPTSGGSRDELSLGNAYGDRGRADSANSRDMPARSLLAASLSIPNSHVGAGSCDTLSSGHSSVERPPVGTVVCEGCLKRKTQMKGGRRPPMASWTKYWVTLSEHEGLYYLHYFHAKTAMYARERHDFKKIACKTQCLKGSLVVHERMDDDCFQLVDLQDGHRYKFRVVPPLLGVAGPGAEAAVASPVVSRRAVELARRWVEALTRAVRAMDASHHGDLIEWTEEA